MQSEIRIRLVPSKEQPGIYLVQISRYLNNSAEEVIMLLSLADATKLKYALEEVCIKDSWPAAIDIQEV